MLMILETDRLRIRQWTRGEEVELTEFLADPEVMLAYEEPFTQEEIVEWLRWNIASYETKGYGLWAVELKETKEVIGECGLTDQWIDGRPYFEITHHFKKSAWHEDYMLEATQAIIQYAFESLGAHAIVAIVRDVNIESMNVAIQNGMTILKRIIKEYKEVQMPHYIFKIER